MFAAVVDTNVVVSGLTTAADDAAPVRILAGMLAGSIPFVVSETLLAEYRDVLNRPKLRKRHGLTRAQIETLLIALAQNAIVLTAATGPAAPDPGDQHLWALLASHEDLCLVTGDKLLCDSPAPAPVFTPAAFIQRTPRDK